jgi:uncharacterized LabA/DUF88 family protein
VGKNVAVFVDVANIFYAAKAAGVDIDYVTLLKASSAGRDLVRAYAYTGLDPDNENQRNFHDFLRRHGYRVVSKDIRKYGDGKVKANLDIELVVDMMKTARNLDVAIVVSGDGDFAPAIRAVQEQGVRVEVVSFRGNTSSDLMDVADLFTDITQIAKVEKGSSRSGRRVATDDEDLSMTEVPDKQSEGSTERGRGRGRSRRTTPAATTAASGGSRGRGRVAAVVGEGALVALPGEKLSRAASAPELEDADLDEAVAVAELDGADAVGAEAVGAEVGESGRSDEGPRRRRRRGGRGRGRGRGREEGLEGDAEAEDRVAAVGEAPPESKDEAPPPARRPASTFGSVWDSQIGIAASRGAPIVDDDEDLEEPAVPEYLLAERRQRDAGRGGNRGGRGRGGAYAQALDRERFGGGRGSTPSRFGEPPPRREGAYGRPASDRDRDRGERDRGERDRSERDRSDRQPFRQPQRPAPRPSGDEPWSEVPPEIEAMLRAQIGSRPAPARPATPAPEQDAAETATEPVAAASGRSGSARRTSTRGPRSGAAAPAAAESGMDEAPVTAEAKPAARRTRRTAAAGATAGDAETSADPAPIAAKRTTTRKATTTRSRTKASASAASGDATGEADAAPSDATVTAAPKRRSPRRKAEPAA